MMLKKAHINTPVVLWSAFPAQTPYHYAYNSPLTYRDPTGLAPEKEKEGEELMGGDGQYYSDPLMPGYMKELLARRTITFYRMWQSWQADAINRYQRADEGLARTAELDDLPTLVPEIPIAINGTLSDKIDWRSRKYNINNFNNSSSYFTDENGTYPYVVSLGIEVNAQRYFHPENGRLSWNMARNLYRYGIGRDVLVDLSTYDLTSLSASQLFPRGVGSETVVNLIVEDGFTDAGLIFGQVRLTLLENNEVEFTYGYDEYNFEMHSMETWKDVARNLETIGARMIHNFGLPNSYILGIFGGGTPFKIFVHGKTKISP